MIILDEEKKFYIPSKVIKKQVLTKENSTTLLFNKHKMIVNVEKLKLPLFSSFFYKNVYETNKIPSFLTFFNSYIEKNCDFLKEKGCLDDFLEGLKVRMSKSYVSLVRELYIRCFLKENGVKLLYNSNDDMKHDVDAWILIDDCNYLALSIYLKSPYSDAMRKHKVNKRILNIDYLDFAYDLLKIHGDCIYFPSNDSMFNLINKINSYGH